MKKSRNIVICCDGTGNDISENISNVLKFYRCLRKTEKTEPRQLVFYDPGVGTLERPDPWQKLQGDAAALEPRPGRRIASRRSAVANSGENACWTPFKRCRCSPSWRSSVRCCWRR
jgi:hypothetical protein